jgi:hypothetical protein
MTAVIIDFKTRKRIEPTAQMDPEVVKFTAELDKALAALKPTGDK